MTDKHHRKTELTIKYFKGTLNEDEKKELEELKRSEHYRRLLGDLLNKKWLLKETRTFYSSNPKRSLEKIRRRIYGAPLYFILTNWKWISVAAALIPFIVLYFADPIAKPAPGTRKSGSKTSTLPVFDIAPGGFKAVLVLDDSRNIHLNDQPKGQIAVEGRAAVINQKGELVYVTKPGKPHQKEVHYNEIKTPEGGLYGVILTDSTRVFLNAGSTLRYPADLSDTQRIVELTGEAYFEVNGQLSNGNENPFTIKIMSASGMEGVIKVLGTKFNINAYGDEPMIETTLLNGSLTVTKGNKNVTLKPHQQARIKHNSSPPVPGIADDSIHVVTVADIDKEIAWKDGFFSFENDSINTIVRQLERWYAVTINVYYYDDKAKGDKISAIIPRNESLNNVLKSVFKVVDVRFEVRDKENRIIPWE